MEAAAALLCSSAMRPYRPVERYYSMMKRLGDYFSPQYGRQRGRQYLSILSLITDSNKGLVILGLSQITGKAPQLGHRTQIVEIALLAGYVCSPDGCGEQRGGYHHRRQRLASRPTRIDEGVSGV